MDELIEQLKIAFANTFVFHIKAWGYHWNVEGKDFFEYHSLFENIYTEVQGAIDPLSEQIRQLQQYSPFTMERLKQLSQIQEDNKIPTAQGMAQELLDANEILVASVTEAYTLAEQAHEHGLSNLLAERLAAHRKHAWFLRSSLKPR